MCDSTELSTQLLAATSEEELTKVVSIFNLDMKKRDIIRNRKLSDVLDTVSGQIEKRVQERPDAFSNKDLLDYLNTISSIVTKSDTMLEPKDFAHIQVNNVTNNVVVGDVSLSKESQNRIKDVVDQILASQNTVEYEEVTSVEDNSNETE